MAGGGGSLAEGRRQRATKIADIAVIADIAGIGKANLPASNTDRTDRNGKWQPLKLPL